VTWVRKPNRGDDPDGAPPPAGTGKLTSLQFARVLVERGADVNTRLAKGAGGRGKLAWRGPTPFLMASKTADLPYMKLLIELGADPKIANKEGATPLIAAAGLGTAAADEEAGTETECLAAVEYLLTLGADVNAVDENGETAMHGAAIKNLPKVVQLLAAKGAKIEVWNRKDKWGWTPLLIAQGFRPGNFKPSAETIEAIEVLMRAAGITPPPPPARSTTNPRAMTTFLPRDDDGSIGARGPMLILLGSENVTRRSSSHQRIFRMMMVSPEKVTSAGVVGVTDAIARAFEPRRTMRISFGGRRVGCSRWIVARAVRGGVDSVGDFAERRGGFGHGGRVSRGRASRGGCPDRSRGRRPPRVRSNARSRRSCSVHE
jgi:hypothetical protein